MLIPSKWGVRWASLFLVTIGLFSLQPRFKHALATELPVVVRVEEDWELVLDQPHQSSCSPQVTCVTSANGHVKGLALLLRLNHRIVEEEFIAGGVQLTLMNGDTEVASVEAGNGKVLGTGQEVIRWTQCLEVSRGQLKISLKNGNSSTWGKFGLDGSMQLVANATEANCNQYSPQVAVKNSAIDFGSNRVKKLVLKQVRCYTSDGKVLTDQTMRTVHTQTKQ